ncbi:MAG: alpha/beta hydrolase family protein, partial [Terriglobales bacterium]
MKPNVLRILLAISLLFNVIGVFFVVDYIHALGNIRSMKDERSVMQSMLSVAQTRNVVNGLDSDEKISRRAFISRFDGFEDSFAVQPIALPVHTKAATLFVYLHGMGHTFLEPFETPKERPLSNEILKKDHSFVVMAPNFRAPAGWATDATFSDISQNIREVSEQFPIDKIVIIGSSMGGCVALSYCTLAPKEIKDKLVGVVSIESAGDLAKLFRITTFADARRTMIDAYGGTPDQVAVAYAAKSMMPNLSAAPGQLRFAIVSARQDKIVPPEM